VIDLIDELWSRLIEEVRGENLNQVGRPLQEANTCCLGFFLSVETTCAHTTSSDMISEYAHFVGHEPSVHVKYSTVKEM
jgi:hypothetical protein